MVGQLQAATGTARWLKKASDTPPFINTNTKASRRAARVWYDVSNSK
jgi:hypothetical protein